MFKRQFRIRGTKRAAKNLSRLSKTYCIIWGGNHGDFITIAGSPQERRFAIDERVDVDAGDGDQPLEEGVRPTAEKSPLDEKKLSRSGTARVSEAIVLLSMRGHVDQFVLKVVVVCGN